MIKNTSLKIDVVVDCASLLGEGPVWDNVQKCICWIDILNGKIHQFSPVGQCSKMYLLDRYFKWENSPIFSEKKEIKNYIRSSNDRVVSSLHK